jgi:class 3 adenylate cyclase
MGFLRDQARRALFATMVQTITRYDGFVETVIGDAVTARNTR